MKPIPAAQVSKAYALRGVSRVSPSDSEEKASQGVSSRHVAVAAQSPLAEPLAAELRRLRAAACECSPESNENAARSEKRAASRSVEIPSSARRLLLAVPR
jgi:hypothetical protein